MNTIPKYGECSEAYRQRFGKEPLLFASNAFDAVHAIAAAMISADSIDSQQWALLLRKTPSKEGVSGPIEFNEKGNLRNPYVSIHTYRGNRRIQIE